MKVYGINWCGRERRIVAARSQKEAARLMRTSVHNLREWGCETGNQEEIEQAMLEPGLVWSCEITGRTDWKKVT